MGFEAEDTSALKGHKANDAEWERKQRNREFRVAARREKRNRKADEKKQRKLNATILRRMTRNPDKYNKNAERNRFRDIEGERRRIWAEAIKQAQRLAVVHDPSGATFNVGAVTALEDGTVISLEALRRRKERAAAKLAEISSEVDRKTGDSMHPEPSRDLPDVDPAPGAPLVLENGINPERWARMGMSDNSLPAKKISKTQQRKLEALAPRPPPPKPMIPAGISLPDGEEDWLALWDLSDEQLERRVLKAKKRKAAERKALRHKQQQGKAERRAARDEKRKVYREIKLTWKAIKEEEKQHKRKLLNVEQEETKRIALEVNAAERKAALACCAELGFTLVNTPGVDEIKPKAMGMKGVEVDFDKVHLDSKHTEDEPKPPSKRIDLGAVADESNTRLVAPGTSDSNGDGGDFIELGTGDDRDFEALNYNHKLRRKLRRAVEAANIRKEIYVRNKALEYCLANNIEPPAELGTPCKPVNVRGQRVLEDGTLETAKQERVRLRMELTEYNKAARVLRKQAKQTAIEAGLRKFAELTGALPPTADRRSVAENSLSALDIGDDTFASPLEKQGGLPQANDRKHARDIESDDAEDVVRKKRMG